jgi:hypothetical protein
MHSAPRLGMLVHASATRGPRAAANLAHGRCRPIAAALTCAAGGCLRGYLQYLTQRTLCAARAGTPRANKPTRCINSPPHLNPRPAPRTDFVQRAHGLAWAASSCTRADSSNCLSGLPATGAAALWLPVHVALLARSTSRQSRRTRPPTLPQRSARANRRLYDGTCMQTPRDSHHRSWLGARVSKA